MSNKASVPVWDILVRIFHWSLVLAFIVAYASSEGGGELHEMSGYIVLALVSIRIVWGFIGSKHARFTDFAYSPQRVLAYLRSLRAGNPEHYLGHNPLGGWMVMALLAMLLIVTLSGIKLEDVKESNAEVTSVVVDESTVNVSAATEASGEVFWEEFHEAATNIMLGLIAMHILGVISSSRQHKENLVKAMITGNKER